MTGVTDEVQRILSQASAPLAAASTACCSSEEQEACCEPSEQSSCCEPSAKSSCCGSDATAGDGCGCR